MKNGDALSLPKCWEIKRLDDACEVEYGTRVVRKKDGGTIYPVYGGGGATFFIDTFNRENRLVVARFAMSEQCTRFVSGKFFLNDSGLTLKSKDENILTTDFLNLQMIFLNDVIYSLGRGTAQKNLDVQIVGRGTRLFDGKEFFTIYDFVDAYKHLNDPEWDGEPIGKEYEISEEENNHFVCEPEMPYNTKFKEINVVHKERKPKIKVKLRDGKEREIQSMISTSFWSADGKPVSAEEFLDNLFGELPKLFKDEDELRKLWSNPQTRKVLLEKLDEAGFPKSDLQTLQKLVDLEKSDLYDVLEYVFNGDYIAMTREARAKAAETTIFALLNERQKEFISFVLSKYIEIGVEELDREKLPFLLTNKYQSLEDAKEMLGNAANISRLFIEFQEYLYLKKIA